MENYKDMYKKICRVCLRIINSEKMVSLIDYADPDGLSCFAKAISRFANVSYKIDDRLPINICQKCIYLLKQAIHFKLMCESSEKLLKNVLENNLRSNLSHDKIQEDICQLAMYKHYFPLQQASCSKKSDKLPYIHRNSSKTSDKNRKCLNKNSKPISTETCNKKTEFHQDCDSSFTDFDDNLEPESIEKALKIISEQRNLKEDIGIAENTDLETNSLHEVCDNSFSDIDDSFSRNLQSKIVKQPRKIIPKNGRLKKFKNDHILSVMKKLIEKKEIKKKATRHKQKQRDIQCEICNKILANPHTYDQHMQRHGICKYVCDKCGKGFPVLAELHIHQVSRHGIGPHLQCDHCTYKAPTKLNLKEHVRLHTGERPFTCDTCGLTFRRQAIWRNHQAIHSEKKFQCKICPQKFFRRHQMLAHMNNIHERKYLYVCSVCEATYAKTETVRRHMTAKHGIKRELQGKIRRIDKSPTCFMEK